MRLKRVSHDNNGRPESANTGPVLVIGNIPDQ